MLLYFSEIEVALFCLAKMILNIAALLVIAVIAYLFWFVFLRRHGYGPQQYIERKEGDYDMSYNSKIIKVSRNILNLQQL